MDDIMFTTDLDVRSKGKFWELLAPLVFESDEYGEIIVPVGFLSDFASVPRLPLVYALFGNTSHKSATLHDFLYSKGTQFSREAADALFFEAMKSRGQSKWRRYPMWWAVRVFGRWSYYV